MIQMSTTGRQVWLDLRREVTTTGDIVWGDNTLYSNTEVSKEDRMVSDGIRYETYYYWTRYGLFHDVTVTGNMENHPACQADPLGEGV